MNLLIPLRMKESEPAEYPAVSGLSANAAALSEGALWGRIEAHTAHRWTPRDVVWSVHGCGLFLPSLAPAELNGVLAWDGSQWGASTDFEVGPHGVNLLSETYYRMGYTVGDGETLPEVVAEAYRRYAEYLAAVDDSLMPPGVSRYSVDIGGSLATTASRRADFMARALTDSGAADLLRPFRRL